MKYLVLVAVAFCTAAVGSTQEVKSGWREAMKEMLTKQYNAPKVEGEIVVLPKVQVSRSYDDGWTAVEMGRELDRRYAYHPPGGEATTNTKSGLRIESQMPLVSDLIESATATGEDIKRMNGIYDVISHGDIIGTIHFKGEFMFRPKGSLNAYGVKTVKHGVPILAISMTR